MAQQPPLPPEQPPLPPEQPVVNWRTVGYIDRVRAFSGMLGIGAHPSGHSPAAKQAALCFFASGAAFRETPYGDSVEPYIMQQLQAQHAAQAQLTAAAAAAIPAGGSHHPQQQAPAPPQR